MIKYVLFLMFFLYSCGYPDLDSVPKFDKLVITEDESIDLCNLGNTDKKRIEECLENIDKTENK